jgi:hypothetical protein
VKVAGLPVPKKLIRPNLAIISLKKAKSSKMKRAKFVKIISFKVKIS